MEALAPAIRKSWWTLIVYCETRTADALRWEGYSLAVICADTGLPLFGLPSYPCCMAGFCLHLQALEESLAFAQFTEQNIISVGLNSSEPAFPTRKWESEYHYSCIHWNAFRWETFFFRSVLEANYRRKGEIGEMFTSNWQLPGGCMLISPQSPQKKIGEQKLFLTFKEPSEAEAEKLQLLHVERKDNTQQMNRRLKVNFWFCSNSLISLK